MAFKKWFLIIALLLVTSAAALAQQEGELSDGCKNPSSSGCSVFSQGKWFQLSGPGDSSGTGTVCCTESSPAAHYPSETVVLDLPTGGDGALICERGKDPMCRPATDLDHAAYICEQHRIPRMLTEADGYHRQDNPDYPLEPVTWVYSSQWKDVCLKVGDMLAERERKTNNAQYQRDLEFLKSLVGKKR